MILTRDDINEFQAAIEQVHDRNRYRENIHGAFLDGYEYELPLNAWLSNHPQVFMAGAGLQEYVGAHELSVYTALVKAQFIPRMEQAVFRGYDGVWMLASHRGTAGIYGYSIEKLRRAVESDDDALFDDSLVKIAAPDDVIEKAKKYIDCGLLDPTIFVSPSLWTPGNQSKEKCFLQSAAVPLICALQKERCGLESLHWRELEVIVAEILRQAGMEIHSVTESPQGGRDIIARAHLVPGEVLTIAVEVKHRPVVDRQELHTFLHQNAPFPALMLVTSGRFTAGVIREAAKPENRLRLFLKDGIAIRDMIGAYRPH